MRFLVPSQTIAEDKWRQMPVYEVFGTTAGYVLIGGMAVSAAGTAYSAYSSSEAQKKNANAAKSNGMLSNWAELENANAQKEASLINASYERAAAKANAQISKYQNQLNFKAAMAKVEQGQQNAKILADYGKYQHQFARSQENQGSEEINRTYEQERGANSQVEAAYGASGVAGDTGSPLMVEAHNAGMAQLARMDMAYKTNLAALGNDYNANQTEYQSKLTAYQSTIDAELAHQYEYGQQVADWSSQMADVAYNNNVKNANTGFQNTTNFANASLASNMTAYSNAMSAANNTATAGYISATGSLLSAAGGFIKPNTTGNFAATQSVQGKTYYNDPSRMMYVAAN